MRAGHGMSGLSTLVAARRPEEAVLAAPGRDVAVTTTVLARAALAVNDFQPRWGACRPGYPVCSRVPDTAREACRL